MKLLKKVSKVLKLLKVSKVGDILAKVPSTSKLVNKPHQNINKKKLLVKLIICLKY